MSAVSAPFDFTKLAKKFKAKSADVLAFQHKGEPTLYPGLSETAHDGDYVVQTGAREQVETIPPSMEGDKRIPGRVITHTVPKLEVIHGQDFEDLYSV